MMRNDFATILLIVAIVVLAILWLGQAGDPPRLMIAAAYGVQCKPPTLDYSRRPVRLDVRSIA